jgi:hypothetical protein
MKKSYIYNSPKRSANDSAQMLGPSEVVRIYKRAIPRVVMPVPPGSQKAKDKGQEGQEGQE